VEYIILFIHLAVNASLGLSIIKLFGLRTINAKNLAIAIALGMFLETLVIWLLLLLGLSVFHSFLIIAILAAGAVVYSFFFSNHEQKLTVALASRRPSFLEGIIFIFIAEKAIWSLYSLSKLPVYFDDTLNHWSGRGKALLDGVNWSWDPASIYFMGKAFGHEQYPLFASIWRAVNAALLGRHDAGLERVDGFILWMIILILTTYWIKEYSGKLWLGLLGAAIIAGIPLQTWHATAGYAEIYIQAYLLLGLYAIFQNKYILAGLLSAAMIWSKNEGLVIFVPCIISCLAVKLFLEKSRPIQNRTKDFFLFNATWIVTMLPWILFKLMKGVGFTIPTQQGLGYVEGAISKMATAVFNSPSSSILWLFFTITIIVCIKRIVKSKVLLPLAISCFILITMMTFIFTSTGAYRFLENQMTIHRSLLQIAPPFVILVVLCLIQKDKAQVSNQAA